MCIHEFELMAAKLNMDTQVGTVEERKYKQSFHVVILSCCLSCFPSLIFSALPVVGLENSLTSLDINCNLD